MNWKTALKYVLFLGIGAALFYFAFAAVDDKAALWAYMQSAEWWGIGRPSWPQDHHHARGPRA